MGKIWYEIRIATLLFICIYVLSHTFNKYVRRHELNTTDIIPSKTERIPESKI